MNILFLLSPYQIDTCSIVIISVPIPQLYSAQLKASELISLSDKWNKDLPKPNPQTPVHISILFQDPNVKFMKPMELQSNGTLSSFSLLCHGFDHGVMLLTPPPKKCNLCNIYKLSFTRRLMGLCA